MLSIISPVKVLTVFIKLSLYNCTSCRLQVAIIIIVFEIILHIYIFRILLVYIKSLVIESFCSRIYRFLSLLSLASLFHCIVLFIFKIFNDLIIQLFSSRIYRFQSLFSIFPFILLLIYYFFFFETSHILDMEILQ